VTGKLLLVGAGGIGAPCALALANAAAAGEAPPFELIVLDDDRVERSNLHRQILFTEGDVGLPKVAAFAARLREIAPSLTVSTKSGRFVPDVALDLAREASLIVDATDNFASRFLLADAARIAGRPVVHAASVRWHATVIAASAMGAPCYRCLFEDLPEGDAPDCATAGVVGPVCGVAGALAADLALSILRGETRAFGFVVSFDGQSDRLRRIAVKPRAGCALCGTAADIRTISEARYVGPACDSL
jgi:molybdopterin/thiamine biosynthesis adenylyltransferase